MIEQMSPPTRRIAAVGLLVLLILLAATYIVVPLVGGISAQRDELAALRARAARLQATLSRPLPPISPIDQPQLVAASSPQQASRRLQALLAGDAAASGVSLRFGPTCVLRDAPRLLCADISTAGSENNVAQFLSLIEHGRPVVRFRSWQLFPGQGTDNQLYFTGRAMAVAESSP